MKIKDLKKLTDVQLSQLKDLTITNKKLTKEKIADLIKLLPQFHSLDMLTFKKTNLKGKLFAQLVDQLPQCPRLSYLCFPDNHISNEDLVSLIDALPKFNYLVSVELTNNKLTDLTPEDLDKLLKNIQRTGSLVSFNVDRNQVNEDICKQIGDALDANKTKSKQLIAAVEKGDIREVRFLLLKGANINSRIVIDYSLTTTLQSPLHVAAKKGNIEMVKFLVSHGAKVWTDGLGRTPSQRAQYTLNNLAVKKENRALRAAVTEVIDYLSSAKVLKLDNGLKNQPLPSSASDTGLFAVKSRHAINNRKEPITRAQSVTTFK